MALKSTVFKVDLQVADMNRHYYANHALTLARHPSETDERMMVRLLAFGFHADEYLTFGKGLSDEDEPALWQKDLTGAIALWIEVGLPDVRALRKACGRAKHVWLYAYGGRAVDVWWSQNAAECARLTNLAVVQLAPEVTQAAAAMAERTMQLQFTREDADAWLGGTQGMISVPCVMLKSLG